MKRILGCGLLFALAIGCGKPDPPPATEDATKKEREIRNDLEKGSNQIPKRN